MVSPLADLEAQQFPLIQSCVFQWMVSASVEVRNASLEAEKRLDAHFLLSRCILHFFLSNFSIVGMKWHN